MTQTPPQPSSRPAQPVVEPPDIPEPQTALAERTRIIQEIRTFNTTADSNFLAQFDTLHLRDYLEHLRHVRHKQIRLPGWVQRRSDALAEARRQLQLRRVG
jgi:hypothetical protein